MSDTTHDTKDEKYTEIVAQLQKSIEVPGKVVMILHPWNQPVVLSRAWCLVSGLSVNKVAQNCT